MLLLAVQFDLDGARALQSVEHGVLFVRHADEVEFFHLSDHLRSSPRSCRRRRRLYSSSLLVSASASLRAAATAASYSATPPHGALCLFVAIGFELLFRPFGKGARLAFGVGDELLRFLLRFRP